MRKSFPTLMTIKTQEELIGEQVRANGDYSCCTEKRDLPISAQRGGEHLHFNEGDSRLLFLKQPASRGENPGNDCDRYQWYRCASKDEYDEDADLHIEA